MIPEELEPLQEAISRALPRIIKEFNESRLPSLEGAWGRPFEHEFDNESQKTVEITKQFARPLNNCFYRHVKELASDLVEDTTDGYDYKFGNILLEDKNSFSESNNWVGNGFAKSDWHVLKKFKVDETGRITHAFVCLANVSQCKGEWSDKTVKTNRSTLKFCVDDYDDLVPIYGHFAKPKTKQGKYLMPVAKKI